MPFIDVKTSKKFTDNEILQLKSELGESISIFPGKTEAWLMINIDDNCNMFFKGDNGDGSAYVEVSIFGSASKDKCESFTQAICKILDELAGISSDRIYVKYEFSDMWGYDNFMF